MDKCIACNRGSLQAAAADGLSGFIKCLAETGYYGNRASPCANKRFQAADAETVRKREAWFAKRSLKNERNPDAA